MCLIASAFQSQSGSSTEVGVVHQREDHKGRNKNGSDNGGALHLGFTGTSAIEFFRS